MGFNALFAYAIRKNACREKEENKLKLKKNDFCFQNINCLKKIWFQNNLQKFEIKETGGIFNPLSLYRKRNSEKDIKIERALRYSAWHRVFRSRAYRDPTNHHTP